MLKPRFSLLSVSVMISITAVATYLATRFDAPGLELSAGIPFKWYFWADYHQLGQSSVRWHFVLLDILIWIAVVFICGWATDRILSRGRK